MEQPEQLYLQIASWLKASGVEMLLSSGSNRVSVLWV